MAESSFGVTGGVLPPDDDKDCLLAFFLLDENLTHCSDGHTLHSIQGFSLLQSFLRQQAQRVWGSISTLDMKRPHVRSMPGHRRISGRLSKCFISDGSVMIYHKKHINTNNKRKGKQS